MTVCFPYMINPDEGNMRGQAGFFFGGLAFLCLTWAWFQLPELKGMTFHDVDCFFARGTKARDFKQANTINGVDIAGTKAASSLKAEKENNVES